jgi:hypothetical protein
MSAWKTMDLPTLFAEAKRLSDERYKALGLRPGEGSPLSAQAGAYTEGLMDGVQLAIKLSTAPPQVGESNARFIAGPAQETK